MKKTLVRISLLLLLLVACAPQAQPTDLPSDMEGQATQPAAEFTPAQLAAVDALAQNLGLAADQIRLVSTEAVEWPDSCLGIAREGIACAQAVTSGFRILLEANGLEIEYRTNEDGTVVLPATVALTWKREGGIAGFCDNLTVYLSGEVQGTNCNTSQIVEKRLSDLLTSQQIAVMNQWIQKYGVLDIDMSDPAGMADGMSVRLMFMGQGTEQLSPEVQQLLLQFVQDLNQRLMAQ